MTSQPILLAAGRDARNWMRTSRTPIVGMNPIASANLTDLVGTVNAPLSLQGATPVRSFNAPAVTNLNSLPNCQVNCAPWQVGTRAPERAFSQRPRGDLLRPSRAEKLRAHGRQSVTVRIVCLSTARPESIPERPGAATQFRRRLGWCRRVGGWAVYRKFSAWFPGFELKGTA
jgi:hypothetical protein